MKVEAAVVRAQASPLSMETLDLEAPRDGEILVRLVATGICHTDIAMRDQAFPVPQPIVLGHEGAGVVEQVGHRVKKVEPGDHVIMSFNSCGQCPSCQLHMPGYCHDFFDYNFAGRRPDGSTALSRAGEEVHSHFFGQSSFFRYSLCHERNVVKVRKDAPLELLGPLACGIQTGAGTVINALRVGVGESLAVFGTGSVGISAIMAARLTGAATIIGIDRVQSRLDLAKALGATHVINAEEEDIEETLVSITGAGVNYTFETTGAMPVLRQAVDCLAPLGICGFVGAAPVGSEVSLDVTHVMTGGRRLHGIVEGESVPDVFIPKLVDLHMQGRFPFDELITFYPFEKINEAIHASETGEVIKPVLRMT